MTRQEKENWTINIENTAIEVSNAYGSAIVQSVLRSYNAQSIYELSPSNYDAVFSELYAIASDI